MHLLQFLRRMWRCTKPSPVGSKPPDIEEKPKGLVPEEQDQLRRDTAADVLHHSLRTLSTMSNRIADSEDLSGTVNPLLEITARIKQTSDNAQSLAQLAERLGWLTGLVERMAEDDRNKGQAIVQSLRRQLASMTDELRTADTRGQLDHCFSGGFDNSSFLQKYNDALTQIIAEATFITVHEVNQSLHNPENSKLRECYPPEKSMEFHIAGGTGSDGGYGHTGGRGGQGDGPQLELDPDGGHKVSVSGGTGGNGGNGLEVGGKGGTGKGPMVRMRRRVRPMA
ncbi:hypothetical protein C8R45DRAFT_376760 [Mycena sanguinolenta]|nr:hypothetical protein C8R45DRAFT_376760 [Mycena sanguinolenta]